MATFRIVVKAIVLLCVILFCYVVEAHGRGLRGRGRGRGRGHGRGGRGGGIAAAAKGPAINVLQFGAKPGGKKDSSIAFVKAWNKACKSPGNARLLIPAGEFLTGPVVFQGPCLGPITVQVSGTVKAITDMSAYEEDFWFSFEDIDGLQLTGGGTFDGQGAKNWEFNDCKENPSCQMLPSNLKFMKVRNSNVRQIRSVNSMGFQITLNNCDNLGIQGLTVISPATSPNTDGIHLSESTGVKISRSRIATGDDCISVGQGSKNIDISQVTCGPGHGISVGSLGKRPTELDVNGVTVKNCTFIKTDNGVRIKTWGGSIPLKAQSLYFQDLVMSDVKNPIMVDQNYCGGSSNCNKGPSRVQISDLRFTNIKGTSTSPVPVSINCSPSNPCQSVQMNDINLRPSGATPDAKGRFKSECSNVKVGYGGMQVPGPCG